MGLQKRKEENIFHIFKANNGQVSVIASLYDAYLNRFVINELCVSVLLHH